MTISSCSVDGCERTGKMRLTYCENHYRKHKRNGTPTPEPRVTHGTPSMYRYGCRCTPCRAGHAARYQAWSRANHAMTGEWQHGRWIPDADRLAIYERDAWTCMICLDPIDQEAEPNTPWAPSLDHIVPRSSTACPDHSPTNLRTAHMWCNAVRGDATRLTDDEIRAQKRLVPAA